MAHETSGNAPNSVVVVTGDGNAHPRSRVRARAVAATLFVAAATTAPGLVTAVAQASPIRIGIGKGSGTATSTSVPDQVRNEIINASRRFDQPHLYRTEQGYDLEWSTEQFEVSVEITGDGAADLHATDVEAMTGTGTTIPRSSSQAEQIAEWLAKYLS